MATNQGWGRTLRPEGPLGPGPKNRVRPGPQPRGLPGRPGGPPGGPPGRGPSGGPKKGLRGPPGAPWFLVNASQPRPGFLQEISPERPLGVAAAEAYFLGFVLKDLKKGPKNRAWKMGRRSRRRGPAESRVPGTRYRSRLRGQFSGLSGGPLGPLAPKGGQRGPLGPLPSPRAQGGGGPKTAPDRPPAGSNGSRLDRACEGPVSPPGRGRPGCPDSPHSPCLAAG